MGFCKTTHILQLTLFLLVKQQLSPSPKLLEFMYLNRLVSLILRDDSLRDLTIQSLVLGPNMD